MKSRIIVTAACLLSIGCGRYSGWEYVRIEEQLPSKTCVYKIQEACSEELNECFNWHKKRATLVGANTVVITQSQNQMDSKTGFWRARIGENNSTLADYYYCNGPKNIPPK